MHLGRILLNDLISIYSSLFFNIYFKNSAQAIVFPKYFKIIFIFCHLFLCQYQVLVAAYGIYFPAEELNLELPHCELRVSASGPPKKSPKYFLITYIPFFSCWLFYCI